MLNLQDFPADLPRILLQLVDELESGIIILDNDEKLIYWNGWVEKACKNSLQEVLGKSLQEIFPELKGGRILSTVDNCLSANMTKRISNKLIGIPFPFTFFDIKTRQEHRIEQRLLITPLGMDDSSRYCLIHISDVTRALAREKYLKKQSTDLELALEKIYQKERHIRTIFENTKDAIITFDSQGQIEDLNPHFEKIFDYPKNALLGCHIGELIQEINIVDEIESQVTQTYSGEDCTLELTAVGFTGNTFPVEFTLGKMELGGEEKFVAIVRDVTSRKETEKQLTQLARRDNLTGLWNRSVFHEKIEEALGKAKRGNHIFALLFIDLDRIKTINDSLGHHIGDELLVHVAHKLVNLLRKTDIIARFGGDEFTLIIDQLPSRETIAFIVKKIISGLAVETLIQGYTIAITTCIGVAVYPDDGQDSTTLVKNADTALYAAKDLGPNSFSFFAEEMNIRAQKRLELEADLRNAEERDEMVLYFQPQVGVSDGRIVGGEALIRWNHPVKGMISPLDFIPLAEETALILPIGEWIIRDVTRKLLVLNEKISKKMKIGINVSSKQFKSQDLPRIIRETLEQSRIAPSQLVVEITESHLVEDARHCVSIMNQLKELGIRIALDDFGTGYSSLSYLRTMPIDILKIDRSFINDIEDNDSARHILKAIIRLAHNLKMEVVAEGVETGGQLKILKSMGCDQIQGYYLAKPLQFSSFVNFVEQHPLIPFHLDSEVSEDAES